MPTRNSVDCCLAGHTKCDRRVGSLCLCQKRPQLMEQHLGHVAHACAEEDSSAPPEGLSAKVGS